ncbi:MAG TPA: hypothetical protein VFQ85_17725 [Mycobacteriales bacterium]|nr:hypothetical protein [Mycobacteriales bacterium]
MDRDALLVAALGAAVLTGCTPRSDRPGPATPSPLPSLAPDPDQALLAAWAAAERLAAARYDRPVRAIPALAPLRANHLARARAVEARLTASPSAAPAPPALGGPPAAVVRALVTAERALAASYAAAVARAADPEVVLLGATLAAGARQHAALLPILPLPKAPR